MILVGLTGGVATGKTTVANAFKRCGALVIKADQLARDMVKPGKPAWHAIVRLFGKGILRPDRTINRHELGAIVFRDRSKLRRLERIIHPRVAREQACRTKAIARKHSKAVVIYEVPLLFEAGVDRRVDRIIVVTAGRETQIARLKARNGLSRNEAIRRIRSQMPLSSKRRRADYVLDGTMQRSELDVQISELFRQLQALT